MSNPAWLDRFTEIIEAMRAERPRYKSHDLGFVDSVSAARVDEWADELEGFAKILRENATAPPVTSSDVQVNSACKHDWVWEPRCHFCGYRPPAKRAW